MNDTETDPSHNHDLYDFMQENTFDMANEYQRIQKRAAEDPGTAGDQGEENWATLLRDWLPTTYEVVTKGRIIGQDGNMSPQIDVVVLSSSYPTKLLDKKVFLAGGVVAAFECKNTLKAEHLKKVVETAKLVKNLYQPRRSSPYRELQAPIIYGLLAHSHSWKGPNSTPHDNVTNTLFGLELDHVEHPRELLDIVCIADLATWTRSKLILLGTSAMQWRVPGHGDVNTSLMCHSFDSNAGPRHKPFTPIGSMIGSLFSKLAYEDTAAANMARYYSSVGLVGSASGSMRPWSSSVFTDETKEKILTGHLKFGNEYPDEWHHQFG